MNRPEPKVLGITGPIGSGKSAAMALFSDCGIPTFDADRIAKALMTSRADVREKITGSFGDVYRNDTLDTKKLSAIVFHDARAREVLNAIVHPPTLRAIDEMIAKLETPLAVVESALIFSSHIEKFFDYILIIDAPKNILIDRVMKRNAALSRQDVEARLAAQTTFSQHYNDADFVIDNSGTLQDFKSKISFILSILTPHAILPTEGNAS